VTQWTWICQWRQKAMVRSAPSPRLAHLQVRACMSPSVTMVSGYLHLSRLASKSPGLPFASSNTPFHMQGCDMSASWLPPCRTTLKSGMSAVLTQHLVSQRRSYCFSRLPTACDCTIMPWTYSHALVLQSLTCSGHITPASTGLSPPLLSPGQPGGALGARLSGNGGHASPSAAPMFGTGGSVFGVGGSVFGASGPSLDSVGPSIGGGGVSLGGAGPTFGAMLTDPGVQARASGGSGGLRSPLHSQGGATSEYAALLQSRASGDGNQIGARLSGGGGGLAPAGPSLDAPLSAAASGERGFHSRLGAGGGNGQGLMALGGSSMQGSAPVRPANAAMLMMQNRGLMGVSPRASNSGTTAGGAGAGADRMRKL
jgi:hypothetical protein